MQRTLFWVNIIIYRIQNKLQDKYIPSIEKCLIIYLYNFVITDKKIHLIKTVWRHMRVP